MGIDVDKWDWCKKCNRKHRKNSRVAVEHPTVPMTKHSNNNHFYRFQESEQGNGVEVAEENGDLVELGIPQYAVYECEVCGKRKKEKYGWR